MDYKSLYNDILKRYKKAERYFEDIEVPLSEKEKYFPEFRRITVELGNLLELIREFSEEEVLNGFNI